jgi:hypothetical protein
MRDRRRAATVPLSQSADGQDRTCRSAYDLLRGRSKEREAHAAPSLRAHDDQIGGLLLRHTKDLAMRSSEDHQRVNRRPGLRLVRDECSQLIFGIPGHVAAEFRDIEVSQRSGLFFGKPLEDGQERHATVRLPHKIQRESDSLQRRRREVHWTEDALERDRLRGGWTFMRRHGEDGTRRFAQHTLRDRTHDQPLEAAMAVSAHDDQIRLDRQGLIDDHRSRVA